MEESDGRRTGPRVRTIPIQRIASPEAVNVRTVPIKKLDQQSRFLLHTNPAERTIKAGQPISSELNSRRQFGTNLAPHRSNNRVDAYSHRNQASYQPTGANPSVLYSRDSLKRSPDVAELSPGIRLVAQYGISDPHSTASTPSASHPKAFSEDSRVHSSRAGSLPTSYSAILPSNRYQFHKPRPTMPRNVSPMPGPAEIVIPGRQDDADIVEARNEEDYHLVESGSDVVLSDRAKNVPEPAPTERGMIGATTGTLVHVPETDILDSSCSSDEDELMRDCDFENQGNVRGMNHDDESVGTSGDEIDDKEFNELCERELIVEKYEKGPDGQKEDWDDPAFYLYKVTDRYGFVHKNEDEIDADKKNKERVRIKKELTREHKWLDMIEEWKQRHPAKLPERIWKGVPEKLRPVVWQKLLRSDDLKSLAKPNLYHDLVVRARLVSSDIRQIDLDVNRTYRDHLAFRKRYDVKQQSLFSVLAAYAMYNTEIGYCQGMSQIAGLFLMYMDEEDAFWCLHSLLVDKRYTMHGMFVPGFPKLQRFQEHYEKVLMKYLPKLKKHFDNEGVFSSYLTKWWFGCFLDRVPFPLVLRVWDVFLYYGDSILIAMAYNIMYMHRKKLRKLSMEHVFTFIQNDLVINFGYSFDDVMDSLHKCLSKLQSDRMALPHPAAPGALSEIPTKPLGPILTRSMVDIRMDLAEVHSRGSRANSLAGKSPAVNRRKVKNSPLPGKRATPSMPRVPSGIAATSSSQGLGPASGSSPSPPLGEGAAPEERQNGHHAPPEGASPQNMGGFNKSLRPLRPVIPDSDGFVPMSPRRKELDSRNRGSVYDNVPPTAQQQILADANVFGYGGHRNSPSRASENRESIKHSREAAANRVRQTQNNVTYVEVGGEEPNIPPPDYDAGYNDQFSKSEKLSRTVSAYQNRRGYSPKPTTSAQNYGGPSVRSGHSLKQRPTPAAGRYYFEPDPPGVVPLRDPSPSHGLYQQSQQQQQQHQQHRQQPDLPRHKHSFV